MLNEILDYLAPGWVGSLIGLIGIAAAGITYVLSRQRAIISYRTRGVRLLGHAESKLPDEVTVLYRGKDIPRLTRSVVVLWNDGEKTVLGVDIVSEDPIRVDVGDDGSVVACTVLTTTRSVLQVTCQQSKECAQTANISFSFLDPKDGLVVEILHTGKERYPKVKGTIRGMPQGLNYRGRSLSLKPSDLRWFKVQAIVLIGIGVVLFGVGSKLPIFDAVGVAAKSDAFRYLIIIFAVLTSGFGSLLLLLLSRRYPRALQSFNLE